MATFTTYLELKKPVGGENFDLLNDFNANWDKLDAFVGECRNTVQSGVSSISGLSTLLDSLLTAMPANGVKAFQLGFSNIESPFTQATYFGTLYKSGTGTTYSSAVFRRCDQHAIISGVRNTNGWSFQQLAAGNITEYSGTKNDTYLSAIEGRATKYGRTVSGFFVITAGSNFSAADLALISGLPAANNSYVQLPCICLSGTDIYKASRVRITTSGNITTWYGFGFNSGASYLISVNYICA